MLASMRTLSNGFVSKLLMLFLVISFGIWGVGDMVRGGNVSYAAKVGSEIISPLQFEVQKQRIARQIQAMGVQGFDPNTLNEMILRQLVQQKLLGETIQELGFFIGEPQLVRTLRKDPQFLDEKGKFSSAAFKAILANNNLTEADFVSQLKADTANKFLLSSLDMSDVVPPTPALTLEATAAAETRDAIIVTVPASTPAKAPTDEMLTQFYDMNKDILYRQAEQRTLEYVMLAPNDIQSIINAAVTDEMVKQTMASKPGESEEKIRAELRASERERVLHDLRNTIEDEMAAGSSLGEAAAKSGVKAQSILLKDVTAESTKTARTNLEKSVITEGFKIAEGEVSNLVTTPEGVSFIATVKTVHAAAPKAFDVVKADVTTRVIAEQKREAARTKVSEVKDALAKEPNWQAALTPFGLYGRPVASIPRLQDPQKPAAGLPSSLQQAIFEREIGQVAGPLSQPNGDQVIAIVTASRHPVIAKEKAASNSIVKPMIEQLNMETQNAAITHFSTQHPVVINPAVLQQPQAAQ